MKNAFVQFVREASDKIGNPQILINMVARRVRQLGQGFRPLVAVHPSWSFMDIALREIADGKLGYEAVAAEEAKPTRRRASAASGRRTTTTRRRSS